MNGPEVTVQSALERIAISLESIALFLQVLFEDQMPIETDPPANTVMTQNGPIELR